jgi:hypothetical protein
MQGLEQGPTDEGRGHRFQIAAAIAWNAAERVMAMIMSKFSRGNSSTGATC